MIMMDFGQGFMEMSAMFDDIIRDIDVNKVTERIMFQILIYGCAVFEHPKMLEKDSVGIMETLGVPNCILGIPESDRQTTSKIMLDEHRRIYPQLRED